MTHCAVAESVFADLRPMLAEYLGEDVSEMDQQEREDRLMMALTDSFASRLDLANQKAELLGELRRLFDNLHREFGLALQHVKEGNGAPGLYEMDGRIDRMEQTLEHMQTVRAEREAEIQREKEENKTDKRDGTWFRLKIPLISGALVLLLSVVFNVYINRTPTPVDKELAKSETTAKQEIEGLKKDIAELKDLLLKPTTVPTKGGTKGKPKAIPAPKNPGPGPGARNRDDEMIARPTLPLYSSMRVPNIPEMRRPD